MSSRKFELENPLDDSVNCDLWGIVVVGVPVMWLFAEVKPGQQVDKDALQQPEIIWGTIALMGALLIGALVIHFVERWRKKAQVIPQDTGDALTDYRMMFERGEITEEEYAKLRDRVAQRVKTTVKPPVSPELPGGNVLPPPPDPGNPPTPPSPA